GDLPRVQRPLRHARGREGRLADAPAGRLHRHGALHAPRTVPVGTGEHGNHDLRNLLASATKYTAAVSEPKQAMQTIQLAIKHATPGTPGPVAVVFGSRSLQHTVKTQRPRRVHATDRVLPPHALRPAGPD